MTDSDPLADLRTFATEAEAYAFLELPLIEPEWRESIIFNLGLIMRIAALVDEFALPDDAETAPIYRA